MKLKNFSFFSTEEVCPIPMDTTFIIDASVCDDSSNWNRLLYFVQTLVTYFNVSPSVGRIALITFSTDANLILKFNTLTGSLLNSAEVNRRVGLLECKDGFRRIDKAINLADKEVLTSAGGMKDISRVTIFALIKVMSTQQHNFEADQHIAEKCNNDCKKLNLVLERQRYGVKS